MKKYYSLFLVFLSAWIVSCHDADNDNNKKNQIIKKISSQTLNCKDFDGSIFISIHDSVVLMKPFMDYHFQTYVLSENNTLDKRYNFVNKNGFTAMSDSYYDKDDSLIYMINFQASTLSPQDGSIIKMLDNGNAEDVKKSTIMKFKWVKDFMSSGKFIALAKNKFLIVGGSINSNELLSIVDNETQKITPTGLKFDDDYSVALPAMSYKMVYLFNSNIYRQSKQENKFLFVGARGELVVLFNITNNKVVNKKFIYSNMPPYEQIDNLGNIKFKCKKCKYTAVRTTEKFIFIRKYTSSRTEGRINDYKGYPWNYSDIIEVYNWNGDYILTLELDVPIYDFIVDDNNKLLLALTENKKENSGSGIIAIKFLLNNLLPDSLAAK